MCKRTFMIHVCLKWMVEDKVVPVHAMMAYGRGSMFGSKAPSILNLNTKCVGVVSFTPQLLCPPRKELMVLTRYEAGWTPERVLMFWRGDQSVTLNLELNYWFLGYPVCSLTNPGPKHLVMKLIWFYTCQWKLKSNKWNE